MNIININCIRIFFKSKRRENIIFVVIILISNPKLACQSSSISARFNRCRTAVVVASKKKRKRTYIAVHTHGISTCQKKRERERDKKGHGEEKGTRVSPSPTICAPSPQPRAFILKLFLGNRTHFCFNSQRHRHRGTHVLHCLSAIAQHVIPERCVRIYTRTRNVAAPPLAAICACVPA